MSKWTLTDEGNYADLEYTDFPAQCDNWPNSEDITASTAEVAKQYHNAIQGENYSGAQLILSNNPRLKNILINADTINRLKHSIMALERMFTDTIEPYIKKFMHAAKAYADNAALYASNALTSAKNAATSESNCSASLNSMATLKKETIDTATSLKNETVLSAASLKDEAKTYSESAAESAESAKSSANYVQQYSGGFYSTHVLTILTSD